MQPELIQQKLIDFLKVVFYHYVENRCGRFRHAPTGHHFNPSSRQRPIGR